MAGEFTRHGYQTQAIGKMHVYPERSQMGFQNVILHDGYLHFARKRERNLDLVDDYLPWLRQQLGREADYLPALLPFVGEASRNLHKIHVTGTLDEPYTTHEVLPVLNELNEKLRQLFPELAQQVDGRRHGSTGIGSRLGGGRKRPSASGFQ